MSQQNVASLSGAMSPKWIQLRVLRRQRTERDRLFREADAAYWMGIGRFKPSVFINRPKLLRNIPRSRAAAA